MGDDVQGGLALVLVLWVLTLLTVIAGSLAMSTRTETQLTGNQLSLARLRSLADAGIQRAIYEFSKPAQEPGMAWIADGRPHEFSLDGGTVSVVAVDESAFIDLNFAPDTLLRGLLIASGASDDEVERLIAAINDWRDADDLTRDNGAEREQYEAAGSEYVPRNGPFQYVEELSMVLGMRMELYRAMAPALTVFSRKSGINSVIAPRQVLLGIPNAAVEEVDAYLQQRQIAQAENRSADPFPPAAPFTDTSKGGETVYNFTALARLDDGTSFSRRAVARLTRNPERPYLILDWKEALP